MYTHELKIVVIEDEESEFHIIKKIINKTFVRPCEIVYIQDYSSLSVNLLCDVDIILADLNISGHQDCNEIVNIIEKFGDIPLIVLTGNENDNLSYDLIKFGVSDFLYKSEALTTKSTLIPRAIVNSIERKQLNKKLKEASEFKSIFLANMSHEIRTPLNVISGLVEIIKDRLKDPDLNYHINILNNSIDSLLMLINNIVDLSKIEVGELEIQLSKYSPTKIIEDVSEIMSNYATKKGLSFYHQFIGEMPEQVHIDGHRIKQILINLIGNSIKFTQEGSIKLEIIFNRETQQLSFTVADTGIGIAEDKLSTIFDEFKQADASTTREYGGSGLGLTIVRKLATLMKGTIHAESAVNIGSKFSLTIPAGIEKGVKLIDCYHLDLDLKKCKVLIIDDHIGEQKILSDYLLNAGAVVQLCSSGIEAIEKYKSQIDTFALIFIDIKMPVLGGFETYKHLNELTNISQKTIFMFPPNNRKNDQTLMQQLNPLGHFYKPINNGKLKQVLIPKRSLEPLQNDLKMTTTLSGKILLAEDFVDNVFVIKEFLKSEDLEITVAENGKEALSLAKENYYDLILMDIQMPELDGLQATKLIREMEKVNHSPHRKIIALTANALKEDKKRCLDAGLDDFLAKPIKKKKLIEVLGKYLAPQKNDQSNESRHMTYNFCDENIDKELSDYMPTYLKNRWDDFENLRIASKHHDYTKISNICHRILGSAQTYGLNLLDDLVGELQKHAKNNEPARIACKIRDLENYLKSAA